MRIIQLTDIHLGLPGEETRGVDTRKNYLDVLAEIRSLVPDLLVISGDICYKEPHQEIFDWVDESLQDFPYPVRMIAGNHDDIDMFSEQYLPAQPDGEGEKYYSTHFAAVDTSVIFLDTHRKRMGEGQLAYLEDEFRRVLGRVVIFMHHPPITAGVGYMDINHALDAQEDFAEVLKKAPARPYIFSGHYHVEKTIATRNALTFITPSTFFQIKHDQDDFAVDHHQIGFRVIDLSPAKMMHRVHYLPGNLK